MNKAPKSNLKKNTSFLFIVVLLAFFSSITAFSQSENVGISSEETLMNPNNIVIENPAKVSGSVINSNVNFILWFMGTKVGPNKTNQGIYTKNQVISTGTAPNHLLMKTLLKKTVNSKFC